jgi:hypothetical protein
VLCALCPGVLCIRLRNWNWLELTIRKKRLTPKELEASAAKEQLQHTGERFALATGQCRITTICKLSSLRSGLSASLHIVSLCNIGRTGFNPQAGRSRHQVFVSPGDAIALASSRKQTEPYITCKNTSTLFISIFIASMTK